MALARWTPLRTLPAFQEEMNRVFNEFFRGGEGGEQGWAAGAWTPAVDIYETEDALVLTAMLPGVSKDEVSIEVHNNTLTLRGERKPAGAVADERYYRRECVYGPFQRAFVLPTTVDQNKVQATYHDGILELHLSKVEAAKPRRISITS
jgi:HSP20 family protein